MQNNQSNEFKAITIVLTILFIPYMTGMLLFFKVFFGSFFSLFFSFVFLVFYCYAIYQAGKPLNKKYPVKQNNIQVCQPHPNTPAHKENTNNNPVKQIFSPNISEVDKLTKQIESIKNDFKIINHEVDNLIFNQFNLLKKNLYLEYEKINWKENTNKEISEKYQTVIDSYVEAMNNEYLKIKQQFTDILNNEIKSKIDNVEKQFN